MQKRPGKLSELTDAELLAAARELRPSPLLDAFFIGFLTGILIFGAAANSLGFLLLLPLFLIYRLLKKPRQHEALQQELRDRGL